MRGFNHKIIVLVLALSIITMPISCSSKNNAKGTFDIEQFQSEMKAKNYTFKIKDVEKDFLPATRKRMIINKEALDIYLFSSNKEMEETAKHIDSLGCTYSTGSKSAGVSWISTPHFYKRGRIIVQYIGENAAIISDLKDILGEQFAGGK